MARNSLSGIAGVSSPTQHPVGIQHAKGMPRKQKSPSSLRPLVAALTFSWSSPQAPVDKRLFMRLGGGIALQQGWELRCLRLSPGGSHFPEVSCPLFRACRVPCKLGSTRLTRAGHCLVPSSTPLCTPAITWGFRQLGPSQETKGRLWLPPLPEAAQAGNAWP